MSLLNSTVHTGVHMHTHTCTWVGVILKQLWVKNHKLKYQVPLDYLIRTVIRQKCRTLSYTSETQSFPLCVLKALRQTLKSKGQVIQSSGLRFQAEGSYDELAVGWTVVECTQESQVEREVYQAAYDVGSGNDDHLLGQGRTHEATAGGSP